MGVPFSAQPSRPPFNLKNPNNFLCLRNNCLQVDEEVKSLAIIVAEK